MAFCDVVPGKCERERIVCRSKLAYMLQVFEMVLLEVHRACASETSARKPKTTCCTGLDRTPLLLCWDMSANKQLYRIEQCPPRRSGGYGNSQQKAGYRPCQTIPSLQVPCGGVVVEPSMHVEIGRRLIEGLGPAWPGQDSSGMG